MSNILNKQNTMKKIIVLTVLSLISLGTLYGQSKVEPSPAIAAEFNKQFAGATNVIWEKAGELSLAKFYFQQNYLVVYFNLEGNLIARGRKIGADQLPLKVHEDLLAIKSEREKKSGVLTIANVFEYSEDSDFTKYVTSLENDRERIVVGTVNGKMTMLSKTKKNNAAPVSTQPLIAKAPEN